MEQKSASISPFSFISPSPCLPISRSLSVLSAPTFAFMSPIKMSMSRFGILSRTDWSWAQKLFLSSSSDVLVGAQHIIIDTFLKRDSKRAVIMRSDTGFHSSKRLAAFLDKRISTPALWRASFLPE